MTNKNLIRDPIYDYVEIPNEFLKIVDSSIFQRLRWVSQLPLEQLVYPSAQHSRFEHSLGAMHLGLNAAKALIQNSKEQLTIAFNEDPSFKKLSDHEQEEQFKLLSGFCALLHDVGHAPFSHTLEDACKYNQLKKTQYDHEQVGFSLSKRLISENALNQPFALGALNVLNKNLKDLHTGLTPVQMIVRKLIDGPIDVDKGDYIARDAYHCGVTYGKYDIRRLWDNIVITDNFQIGVNQKGALEAWTLRLARYKMHMNVYKHHVRNITDSILIEILSKSFKIINESSNDKEKLDIFPINQLNEPFPNESYINSFIYWTDNSLLKSISQLSDPSLKGDIESFLKRDLPKRLFNLDLSIYPQAISDVDQTYIDLFTIKQELKEKGLKIHYLINKELLPPVFEMETQEQLQVKMGKDDFESNSPSEKTFIPLAKFLGFDTPSSSYKVPSDILFVFTGKAERSEQNINMIKRKLDEKFSSTRNPNTQNEIITNFY